MDKSQMLDDKLTSRIEAALDVSNKTLEAIAGAQEAEALDRGLLEDVLALKDRIEGLTIFATNEHFAVKELADRLEPVILAATTVHYIPAEQWTSTRRAKRKSWIAMVSRQSTFVAVSGISPHG
ncbi:MAG: hypothetical protein ABJN39_07775 [Sulfitobacter sp.]|uniref:hypothetical protein n=1 Tax=Alphaproteobacteria TaxID=28211 RepID=UPI002942266A|nr:hypothetical protein [Sulfitobacter sp. LC.270.F.C4]WOI14022.1 hypothetical protein R1T45_12995 [Sulfitobacter sp. LC.270.F.C4]